MGPDQTNLTNLFLRSCVPVHHHTARAVASASAMAKDAHPNSRWAWPDGALYNELMAEKRISSSHSTSLRLMKPSLRVCPNQKMSFPSAGFRTHASAGALQRNSSPADRGQNTTPYRQMPLKRNHSRNALGNVRGQLHRRRCMKMPDKWAYRLGCGTIDWSDRFSMFNAIRDEWIAKIQESDASNWTQTSILRCETASVIS